MLGLKEDSIAMDFCMDYDYKYDSGHQFITQCIDWWGSNRGARGRYIATNLKFYHYDYDANRCSLSKKYYARTGFISGLILQDHCSPYRNVSV